MLAEHPDTLPHVQILIRHLDTHLGVWLPFELCLNAHRMCRHPSRCPLGIWISIHKFMRHLNTTQMLFQCPDTIQMLVRHPHSLQDLNSLSENPSGCLSDDQIPIHIVLRHLDIHPDAWFICNHTTQHPDDHQISGHSSRYLFIIYTVSTCLSGIQTSIKILQRCPTSICQTSWH